MQNSTHYPPALAAAIQEIQAGTHSCIVVRGEAIVHRDTGRGVAPLVRLYQSEAGRTLLAGATVADKIIGKGAAMILHLGGAAYVHGELMSQPAAEYLAANGIPHSHGRLVPVLKNRTGDGMCPIEQSVLDENDATRGYVNILKTIDILMGRA